MDKIIAQSKSVHLPEFQRIADLEVGKPYPILGMRNTTTQFGISVVCDLESGPDDTVSIFLPKRYSSVYEDEDLKELTPGLLTLTVKHHIPLLNGKKTFALEIDYMAISKPLKKKKLYTDC